MKPKQALTVLAVVVVIIAGIAAFEWGIKPQQEAKKEITSFVFPSFDPDRPNRIEIAQGDTAIILVRGGDTAWKVETSGGYPADSSPVRNLLQSIKEMKEGLLSSQNKENFQHLGVHDRGLRVKIKQDQTILADLIIGISGKNYGTTFVRKPDSDKVFLVSQDLNVPKTSAAWRDKMVFSVSADRVQEVQLLTWPEKAAQRDDASAQTMILRRDPVGEWEMLYGRTAEKPDDSKADALARSLGQLRAADFADTVSLADAGLEPPLKKAVIVLDTGEIMTLLVGKTTGEKGDKKFYVKRADRPAVLLVYEYAINNIFKSAEALRPLPGGKEEEGPSSLLPAPNLGTPPAPLVPPAVSPATTAKPQAGSTAATSAPQPAATVKDKAPSPQPTEPAAPSADKSSASPPDKPSPN